MAPWEGGLLAFVGQSRELLCIFFCSDIALPATPQPEAHGRPQETGPGEIQSPGQKGPVLSVCFLVALSQDAFVAETPNNRGVLFCQPEKIHSVKARLCVLRHNRGL